jgi:hypothetical protein
MWLSPVRHSASTRDALLSFKGVAEYAPRTGGEAVVIDWRSRSAALGFGLG